MGCHPSKLKRPSQRSAQLGTDGAGTDYGIKGAGENDASVEMRKHDEDTLSVLRRDLNENPEMFVLNNVLMCTRFLKNYQQEIAEIFNQIDGIDERFVKPDVVMDKANENVTYRPLHGPKKDLSEPLVTNRIYVPMNDFIEVQNAMDKVENSCGATYQVGMEPSRRKGFVKLRRLNTSNSLDRTSLKDVLIVPSSNASGSSDTESSEGTSIGASTKGTPPQLIKDQTIEGTLQDCFVFRKVKKADIDVNLEDLDHKNLKEDDVYDIASYLPSRNFMKYFQSAIFRNSIAKQLGLDQYEIDYAMVDDHVPGKIFCNIRGSDGETHPMEVMPCLNISWPENQTFEFLFREPLEPDMKDMFLWPSEEMLSEIRQLDCCLVPRGYVKKRGEYPEGDLEWEIHFPLAERYMECLLRPEQIKCYLVLLTLYKEYIEPYAKKHGIGPEHFRTLIFWESEIDYDSWPEHRLGIRLMDILHKFSIALHRRDLPDYFIGKKKNVFKPVHMRYLLHANEVFHRITQSPVTMIIRALRNLRTTSGKFYPPLNYKELLDILYKTDWEGPNPYLNFANGDDDLYSSTSLERKPRFSDAEKQLEYVRERERKRRHMRKREKLNAVVKNVGNLKYSVTNDTTRRMSQDSINDDWECEKRFDVQKKIALLKFFINNYLDIAKTSSRINTVTQTKFYLKQAWYLTTILQEENKLFEEEVKDLFMKIRREEEKCEIQDRMGLYTEVTEEEPQSETPQIIKIPRIAKVKSKETPPISPNGPKKDINSNEVNSVFQNINDHISNANTYRRVKNNRNYARSLSRSFSNNYPSTSYNNEAEDLR